VSLTHARNPARFAAIWPTVSLKTGDRERSGSGEYVDPWTCRFSARMAVMGKSATDKRSSAAWRGTRVGAEHATASGSRATGGAACQRRRLRCAAEPSDVIVLHIGPTKPAAFRDPFRAWHDVCQHAATYSTAAIACPRWPTDAFPRADAELVAVACQGRACRWTRATARGQRRNGQVQLGRFPSAMLKPRYHRGLVGTESPASCRYRQLIAERNVVVLENTR
jgi:hypothetical protein